MSEQKYRAVSVHGVMVGVGTTNKEGGESLYMVVPQSMIEPSRVAEVRERCERVARALNAHADLLAACDSAVQIIEQLIPEPSARGVADVVLFQLRAAIAKAGGGA